MTMITTTATISNKPTTVIIKPTGLMVTPRPSALLRLSDGDGCVDGVPDADD
jgi:hypothetical protein